MNPPDQEVKLSITPLIDVTFLLLIFFMCAMKFKTLDQKVQAWLPTEKGLNPENTPVDPEEIAVQLVRGPEDTATRVRLLDTSLGDGDNSFVKLESRLIEIAERFEGDAPEVRIDAGGDVPHQDVMRCVDACLVAGLSEVRFRGTGERR